MAERLVSNTVATELLSTVEATTGKRVATAALIQNLGPNAIYIELNGTTPVVDKSIKIVAGASLALSGELMRTTSIKALAATAAQLTGAATIVIESH